jgi:hypothetical protein
MNEKVTVHFSCVCGEPLARETLASRSEELEVSCSCGRQYELELQEGGRAPRLEPLTPEARQPLAGFSSELKGRGDCQRYYFSHRISDHRVPVHILFSPSAKEAEVKTGDMKPLRFAPVRSPIEARRRWMEWFDSRTGRGRRPDWRSSRPRSASSAPPASR